MTENIDNLEMSNLGDPHRLFHCFILKFKWSEIKLYHLPFLLNNKDRCTQHNIQFVFA